ncbi:hypothetical protein D1872_113960 [compost metagenome]
MRMTQEEEHLFEELCKKVSILYENQERFLRLLEKQDKKIEQLEDMLFWIKRT